MLTGTAEIDGETVLAVEQIVVAFRPAGALTGAGPAP
jgi:hypothetical protein